MDALHRVIKVEVTRNEPLNIRGLFTECGEIRALYSYNTTTPETAHYFVEFTDIESSNRAAKLKPVTGIHVFALSKHPRFVSQYRAVNPTAFRDEDGLQSNNSQNIPSLDVLGRSTSEWTKLRSHRVGNTMSCRASNGPGDMEMDLAQSVYTSPLSSSLHLPSAGNLPTGFLLKSLQCFEALIANSTAETQRMLGDINCDSPSLLSSQPFSSTTPFSPALPDEPAFLSVVPSPSIFSAPTGLFPSLDSRISMTLCGEVIIYDLQSLDRDPEAIVHLLIATASERGNWMIVGAYYRRTGNVHAAITVITMMLEVMGYHKVPESELKPAFLMLSGCETDLAKAAKSQGADHSVISTHYHKSQKWLQKVYGLNAPSTTPNTSSRPPSAPSQSLPQSGQSNHKAHSKGLTPPRAPASLRSRLDIPAPSAPRQQFAAARLSPNHERILEREIQSLRDRQNVQSTLLSEARSTKRMLEESAEYERDVRRKLERQLEDTEKERDSARKMEAYALEQMKREVENRRRAEDRAEAERNLRREAEKCAEKRAKPLLEDLAIMFQRAAQGDGVSLAGLVGTQSGRGSHPPSPFLQD